MAVVVKVAVMVVVVENGSILPLWWVRGVRHKNISRKQPNVLSVAIPLAFMLTFHLYLPMSTAG